MPSAFSPSFPLWEDSFMKSYYFLVLALLLVVISPAAAADMYCDMNTHDQPTDIFAETQSYMSKRGISAGAYVIDIPGGSFGS